MSFSETLNLIQPLAGKYSLMVSHILVEHDHDCHSIWLSGSGRQISQQIDWSGQHIAKYSQLMLLNYSEIITIFLSICICNILHNCLLYSIPKHNHLLNIEYMRNSLKLFLSPLPTAVCDVNKLRFVDMTFIEYKSFIMILVYWWGFLKATSNHKYSPPLLTIPIYLHYWQFSWSFTLNLFNFLSIGFRDTAQSI